MRARNIKPSFFKNEALIELPFEARLLFAGLWCMADREGYLEDRPKRIKIELFPGDDIDVDVLLDALARSQFIRRYSVDGLAYIHIAKFLNHQNPHQRETRSSIPKPQDSRRRARGEPRVSPRPAPGQSQASTGLASRQHRASIGPAPGQHRASPADSLIPDSLIPDSLIPDSLIPDSLIPDSLIPDSLIPDSSDLNAWFADFKFVYPPRAGDQRWRDALRAAHARRAEGHTPDEMIAGARRYAAFVKATGKANTEFVQQAATFLGPGKPFLNPWNLPATKADNRLDANLDTLADFVRGGAEAAAL
jgi:hypothetical protein